MDAQILQAYLLEKKQPPFRQKQIIKAIFRDAHKSFSSISTIPIALREDLDKKISILPFKVIRVSMSKDQTAIKALLRLHDKKIIETVLIAPKPDTWSACISCQVGCAMKCAFCATGTMGFIRNLTTDEITSQILFWRQYLKTNNIHGTFANIVYMGMGEPFMNWDYVKKSIDILTNMDFFGFGQRSISVSTSGVVPGIIKFADECPQINLAISLHFATDKKRSLYMPVNFGHDLHKLSDALIYYFTKNKRKVFIEYIMLNNINDSTQDAHDLMLFLKRIGSPQLLHVNLIRYNSIGNNFIPSPKDTVRKFQNELLRSDIPCTIRKSIGDDIDGACGQLAGKIENC